MRIGAVEAGGTKMVCAIGNENACHQGRFSLTTFVKATLTRE